MRYRVPVTLTARTTYTVEVEADNERQAEEAAIDQWKDWVDLNEMEYESVEASAEQITWECESCGKEITYEEWAKGDTWCIACVTKDVQADEIRKQFAAPVGTEEEI